MKEFDPRTSDMSSDRTKNADGTHEVSRTANGMRAVSERPEQATVVVVEHKRKRYTAQQKLELVRLTYLPCNTVSSGATCTGRIMKPVALDQWMTHFGLPDISACWTSQDGRAMILKSPIKIGKM